MRWLYGFAVATAVFGVTFGGFFSGINATDPAVGQAAQPVICVSGCSGGGGAVFGPTATGSAAANPPVLIGGTTTGGATGTVQGAAVKAGNTAGTTNPAVVVADPNVLAAVTGATPAGTNTIGNVNLASQYPVSSTPITASATGTTTATTATLAANVSATTYICGFSIRANANAVATNNATVTGTITGTLNFTQWTAAAASGLGVTEEIFTPCVPGSAVNTGIAVASGAPGTGGVVSVTTWGYQK